eukprot:maker-scaffold142_size315517-snap-gene-1.9 protein:Tk07699 transcript:maker-scaffold142_size315517-snap-gene-1.9-mRNA-1 annotation:"branched-chain amino acid abc transporter substrate-binding protein"
MTPKIALMCENSGQATHITGPLNRHFRPDKARIWLFNQRLIHHIPSNRSGTFSSSSIYPGKQDVANPHAKSRPSKDKSACPCQCLWH